MLPQQGSKVTEPRFIRRPRPAWVEERLSFLEAEGRRLDEIAEEAEECGAYGLAAMAWGQHELCKEEWLELVHRYPKGS